MLTYPKTINRSYITFRLNSDDYSRDYCNLLSVYLGERHKKFKRRLYHHPTKLISWTTFQIAVIPLSSFEENVELSEELIKDFEKEFKTELEK